MPTQATIDHAYKRLKVLLEATDNSVITFVLYRNAKEQRENAAKLKNSINLPVTEVALKDDNLNPVWTFLDLPKEPRQAIFFTFLGSSLPEGKSDFDKFAGYVNIQREAFEDAPHAVVLWLREEQLVRLMKRAPDFWAWRSGVFDVRGELEVGNSTYLELERTNASTREQLEEQVALYREILKGHLEREEPDLAYVARTRLRLAKTLLKLGLFNEIIIEAEETVRISESLNSDEMRLDALNTLAVAHEGVGNYDRSEVLYREVVEAGEKELGKERPTHASALGNLAGLLKLKGHYYEAEALYREVLKIDKKTLGEEHSNYAVHLNNLASILEILHRYDEAETLYRSAIEISERVVGKQHPDHATRVGNLARLLDKVGRYDEAETLFRSAIAIGDETIGKQHPDYAARLNNLASLLEKTGRYDEAESYFRAALDITQTALGKNHPNYALVMNNLAEFFRKMGRYSEAEPLYQKAITILEDKLGENHPDTRAITGNYMLFSLAFENQKASTS